MGISGGNKVVFRIDEILNRRGTGPGLIPIFVVTLLGVLSAMTVCR